MMNKEKITLNLTKYTRSELENEYIKLDTEKELLEARLKWFEEQHRLSMQKIYGSSSEKTNPDQLTLPIFNEPEADSVPINIEPTMETITYKRKKKKGHKEAMLKDLPVEVKEYRLTTEESFCPDCGESLHEMSKEIRKELKIIPAQISVVEHVKYVYSCRNCEKNNTTTPVITAKMPEPVLKGSLVSPSMMSYIMTRKYLEAMPLYRQEQQLKYLGIELTRQTLSNWMLHGANDWLKHIYNRMHDILITKDIIHADETELQVLCEPGRPAQSKSFMWMYRTSANEVPIILYEYQPSRSGDSPKAFLTGYKGYIHADGYAGYHKVKDVTLVGCWAHARRKFTDTLKALPKGQDIMTVSSGKGLDYCNQLFDIERELKDKSYEERFKGRLEKSKPIVDEFFTWVGIQKEQTLPKSTFGQAITYCSNQQKKLESFLLDGRLELSNNRAERSIKPFIIGRKNWLFSNTPKGANASGIIYSVMETAKENKLNPYEYFKYLFELLPNVDISDVNVLDTLLPWSDTLPAVCKTQLNTNNDNDKSTT